MQGMQPVRRAGFGRALAMVAALMLAACGGGGGNGSSGPYTLGGTLLAADVSMVDSDTNDPTQSGFVANDTPATAQALVTPVTVVGSVNLKGRGPVDGMNYGWGDEEDYFKVSLKAGQVVELLVGQTVADPANDADLCVVSTDAAVYSCSLSVTARECVKVTKDTDYYVIVNEVSSVSAYNLRISAPGQGGACDNLTASASAMVPGQLLAVPATGVEAVGSGRAAKRDLAHRAMRAAGVSVRATGVASSLPVDVIDLPRTAHARRTALATLRLSTQTRDVAAAHTQAVQDAQGGAAPADALPEGVAQLRYAKALRASGGYAAVEPNWLMQRTGALVGTYPPADTDYASQRWHYEQIALPSAMDAIAALPTQPATRPLVAVIDDGVMLDHPDIAPQLFSPGRAFATTTVDGDGDAASGETLAAKSDDSFHGTHVAGTVAASSFDTATKGYGAGVAPMAQILPIRVFRADGLATSLDVVEGIKYAAGLDNRSGTRPSRRADVINMSLGSTTYVPCPALYQAAITAAREAGVIIVAAAGNSARNDRSQPAQVSAPANCTGVFAVAATDALRRQTFYSNSGDAVALAAPGGDPGQRANGSGTPDNVYSTWGTFDTAGVRRASFIGIAGTSMAAPHVTGVFALMKYIHPALTPDDLTSLLQAGRLTEDLGAAGQDPVFGWGLVNARQAVDAALQLRNQPVPPSLVIANPSSLDFGSKTSELTLRLAAAGATTDERVNSLTPDSAAVTIAPSSAGVDAATGLGEYVVRVDRSRLPAATASYFPKIAVALSSGRSFTIQLSLAVIGSSGVATGGNVGPVYVLLINPDTDEVVRTVRATYGSNGRYTWSASGYAPSRVTVLAGTDLDNDGFLCQRAEVCGGYPLLSTQEAMTVSLGGDRTDLDFSIAPLAGTSSAGTQASASGKTSSGLSTRLRLQRTGGTGP